MGGIALRLHPGIATSGLEITPRKVSSRFPILLRSLLIPDLCEVAVESFRLVDFSHSRSLMCIGVTEIEPLCSAQGKLCICKEFGPSGFSYQRQ